MRALNLQKFTTKSMLIYVVLLILALCLLVLHIFGSFKGMENREAMEAAAVGREIVRGNGLNNKVIYPVALYEASSNKEQIALTHHQNTYVAPGHAILNASILALVDGGNADKYKLKKGQFVYSLDRILALSSGVFLFVSIIFSYLLVSEMFDKKLGLATAIILLTSTAMWDSVQSCMPQMFLMMLFSITVWLIYRSLRQHEETNTVPWLYLALCAALFGIMAVTKWLTLWIFVGYFAAILLKYKNRGAIATMTLAITCLFVLPAILFNLNHHGTPFGQSIFTIVNSLATSEDIMLRTFGEQNVRIDDLMINFVELTSRQFTNLIMLLGGIIVAPIFFLTLIHQYSREQTNHFKYLILSMWIMAVIGMSIFGGKELEPTHQIHILFAPVMTILGLSFVQIIWSKLSLSKSNSIFDNAHLVVICLICSAPLVSKLPKMVVTLSDEGGKGLPNAPYVKTAELTTDLPQLISKVNEGGLPIIFSDQPAATAWYSDIHSISLPIDFEQFAEIEAITKKQGIEITGIHTSAASSKHLYANREYLQIMPLVNLPHSTSTSGVPLKPTIPSLSVFWPQNKKPAWYELGKSYPYSQMIVSPDRHQQDFGQHIFHSRKSTR